MNERLRIFLKDPNVRLMAILCVIVLVSFSSTLNNRFVNWDDNFNLTENRFVRHLDLYHIQKIFTSTVQDTYIPLTILSFAVEHHFFGFHPFIYHLNNLLLHLGIVLLIFSFGQQIGLSTRGAFLAALLFGVHPIHVESVAWVSERKDLLYSLFYLLALKNYWRYLAERDRKAYGVAVLWGFLSILSKAMALSLPLVFFVLDWFKGRKFRADLLKEKIPFLLYVIPVAGVTYYFHARVPGDAVGSGFLVWVYTFVFYLQKFVFPFELVPLYRLPLPIAFSTIPYTAGIVLFAGIVWSAYFFRKKKWYLFALLYYFVSIFFLLRYDYGQDMSVVADRFMYLPSLGVCFFVGLSLDKFLSPKDQGPSRGHARARMFVISLFVLLSIKTFFQGNVWENSISLWNHVLARQPVSAVALNNRGMAFEALRLYDLALQDYDLNVKLYPQYGNSYLNRALIFEKKKMPQQALRDYQKAIDIEPERADSYNTRGYYYLSLKKYDKALQDFEKVIELRPSDAPAYNNRGVVFFNQEKYPQAFESFNKALELNPYFVDAYNNRAVIYSITKQFALAIDDYNSVIRLEPKNNSVYVNRFQMYLAQKDFESAMEDLELLRSLGYKIDPTMEAWIRKKLPR